MTARPVLSMAVGGLLSLLAGCADYDPAVRADHDSPKYQADLSACQDSGGAEAARRTLARGLYFLSAPISLPIMQREQIERCMIAKGYARDG